MELFVKSPDIAEDVIAVTGDRIGDNSSWSALSSDQLATLYLWARRALPQAPEYAPGAIVNVNAVHDFPNNIFNALVARETTDAVEAIEGIAKELKEGWPRRAAVEVAHRIRGTEWNPMAVADADDILANPDHRVVTSEPQLAQAFLDTLDEVAAEIGRDPDVAALFWDKQAGQHPVWRPVDEDTFTTRMRARVQDRLKAVVLRQEAQLNYYVGATKGSYPDLEAIAVTGDVTLSVAGEAKGIWHKDVTTSIKTQLADRYVTGVRTNTGIYMVGFFSSDKWDPADSRRAKADKYDIDEFRADLEKQAKELSKDGKTIHVRVIPIRI
jgi:hypothetical protein